MMSDSIHIASLRSRSQFLIRNETKSCGDGKLPNCFVSGQTRRFGLSLGKLRGLAFILQIPTRVAIQIVFGILHPMHDR